MLSWDGILTELSRVVAMTGNLEHLGLAVDVRVCCLVCSMVDDGKE